MNWIGFLWLLWKEVKRFLKVFGQTIISPVITTLLYLVVFGLSLGKRMPVLEGVDYLDFLVPGLVMLIIINNSFMNTTSSLFISKLQGTITDILVAPISNGAVIAAYVLAALLRALLCAGAVVLVAWFVRGVEILYPMQALGYAIVVGTAFSLLGIAIAILSDKFEQLNIALNFFIMPLTFLGGVFYSIHVLPEPWQSISRFNPILYMVDGLRYGFVGVSDVSNSLGLLIILLFCILLVILDLWLLARSRRLRP